MKDSAQGYNTGIEPAIRFYAIEYSENNEEGEEAEILVVQDSKIPVSKKNLVKRKLSYINKFNCEGPTLVNAM